MFNMVGNEHVGKSFRRGIYTSIAASTCRGTLDKRLTEHVLPNMIINKRDIYEQCAYYGGTSIMLNFK
jgi:hypothetical protein